MALRAGNSLSSLAKLFCFIGDLAEIVEWQSVANRKKLAGTRTYEYIMPGCCIRVLVRVRYLYSHACRTEDYRDITSIMNPCIVNQPLLRTGGGGDGILNTVCLPS